MCIIAVKQIGVEVPSEEIIRNCWHSNPDGAGIMWFENGLVNVEKGFMKLKPLIHRLESFTKDDYLVIHFRKSTSAGINPENTHPFPIVEEVDELKRTELTAKRALVHNGVLGRGEADISDTAVFVRDYLSDDCIRENLESICVQNLINEAVGTDKIIIMDAPSESCFWFGKFQYDNETGLYFSNYDYRDTCWTWYEENWSKFDRRFDRFEQGDVYDMPYDFGHHKCSFCGLLSKFEYLPITDEVECQNCQSIFLIDYNEKGEIEFVEFEVCPKCNGEARFIFGEYLCDACRSIFIKDDNDKLYEVGEEKGNCQICGSPLEQGGENKIKCTGCSYEEIIYNGEEV